MNFLKRYFDRLFALALGILTFSTAGITKNPLFFLPVVVFMIYLFVKNILNKKDVLLSVIVLVLLLASCAIICYQAISGKSLKLF